MEAKMVRATGDGEGRTWCRGDSVVLLRRWFERDPGAVIEWIPKQLSHGSILFIEWHDDESRQSLEDDLVARIAD
jgi:hypothetical protein